MSTIDIRDVEKDVVDTIIFADEFATSIEVASDGFGKSFARVYDGSCGYVRVSNKEHAHNLIKALNKAIELGWLK